MCKRTFFSSLLTKSFWDRLKKKKKKNKKNPPSNNIHVRSIKYRDMLQQISSILRAYIDLEMVEEWKFCKGVATTELHCPTRQRYT